MSDGNRKPIIIAAVCAAVAVLVLVVGIGFGGGGSTENQSWQDRLDGFGPSSSLLPHDLRVDAGECDVSALRIDVPLGCAITVTAFGGGFDLGSAVKQVTVTALDAPVTVDLVVEGTSVSQDLEPGDTARLTFGTGGGSLALTCGGFPAGPCAVGLG